MLTRDQKRAQKAFQKVSEYIHNHEEKADFKRFGQRFPSLIHSCGLIQALAFAEAKGEEDYLEALAATADFQNAAKLAEAARKAPNVEYRKHTRDVLASATWVKRYAEALLKGDD